MLSKDCDAVRSMKRVLDNSALYKHVEQISKTKIQGKLVGWSAEQNLSGFRTYQSFTIKVRTSSSQHVSHLCIIVIQRLSVVYQKILSST